MTTKEIEKCHDGALCPECVERVGVPNIPEGDDPCAVPMGYDFERDAHECGLLMCASCGREWAENHVGEIARAWFAHGAYEQSQRHKDAREQGVQDAVDAISAWLDNWNGWSFHDHPADVLAKLSDAIEAGEWREKTDDER